MSTTRYRVTVITSNEPEADTAAGASLTLNGQLGIHGETCLEGPIGQGSTRYLDIDASDLGNLESVHVRLNATTPQNTWLLDRVLITNTANGKEWIFPCNNWLSLVDSDKKIGRTLLPDGTGKAPVQVKGSIDDLIFYDQPNGTGSFYTVQGNECLLLEQHKNWDKVWTHIVPVSYNAFFFYALSTGNAHFCTEKDGKTNRLKEHSWRKIWDIITPFAKNRVLYYSRSTGDAVTVEFDDKGELTTLKNFSGWQRTYTSIVAASENRVFFYQRESGTGGLYETDGTNFTELKKSSDWSKSWDIILPFANNRLLYYTRDTGKVMLYQFNNKGETTSLNNNSSWIPGWNGIVPVSENRVLCYNRGAGLGVLYAIEGGDLTLLKEYKDWSRTWSIIERVTPFFLKK